MKRVLLIHQYAGNKGDRAVAFAMCKLMREVEQDISITISTSSPALWKNEPYFEQHDIKFINNGWEFSLATPKWYWGILNRFSKYFFTILRTLYLILGRNHLSYLFISPEFRRAVNMSDLVISVGGHHFTTLLSRDLVSSINYDAMAVLSLGKPLVCFSQSFGPFQFHNPQNERLTRKILLNCNLLLPREQEAARELWSLGIPKRKIKDTFESVITLCSIIDPYVLPSERGKRVGIAIYATKNRNKQERLYYIKTISDICNNLHQRGFCTRFFPMEIKGTEPDDRGIIREIVDKVQNPKFCFVYDVDMTTEQHICEVAKCQLFIGHKTHSTIFAMLTGTPLVGIAYHIKTRAFMHQFDIEQFCIDDSNLSEETFVEIYNKLSKEIDQIGMKLFSKAHEMSEVIKNDIQLILNEGC